MGLSAYPHAVRSTLATALGFGLVGLASACGGSNGGASSAPPDLARGKTVFVQYCGSCHSLRAAGTKGVVGGPLDGRALSAAAVAKKVRDGGSGMPAFGALSSHDVSSVAAFVAKASR